jgi:tRNA (guanine-N7-)-methyltransferase
MDETPPERRRSKLYGRRKGPRLSQHQASLFETLLPHFALSLAEGRDPRSYFAADIGEVWLEVGFGGGEHLLWQAHHHPDVGLIGAEPYEMGVAKLLSKMAEPLANIRIYQGDARDIIEAMPDESLSRVFILFPDPWPKTRHHKRRFIQTEMLDALARVMKSGAELRFASDDSPYVSWTLERVLAHPAFEWTAAGPDDWKARPADWPATRYEEKALHGVPAFLKFVRI